MRRRGFFSAPETEAELKIWLFRRAGWLLGAALAAGLTTCQMAPRPKEPAKTEPGIKQSFARPF
jgi:hypothetical protein